MTSDAPVAAGRRAAADRPTATTRTTAATAAEPAAGRPSPLADFTFEPHRCFACGELNEHGLQLKLHASASGCWTDLALDERFQGWDSVAHGGIVTTLLDEVMAWSVIGQGTWGVTARIAVSFRKPAPIGIPIRAEGWILDDRRRLIRTAGRVLDPATGTVFAEGEGTFVAAPPAELARLKARYRLRRTPDGELVREAATGLEGPIATTERVDESAPR